MIQKILAQITSAEKALYNAFSYEEEWTVYPLDDKSGCPWILLRHKVLFLSDSEKTFTRELIEDGGNYSSVRYRPAHMKADGHSAFILDTQTDGNKFFTVFQDKLRVTDLHLIQMAEQYA
jgi:hypothetical protein